ncbi:MAG: RluA family pseudouridine synthase [Planctomycetota bacterium]
MNTKHNYIKNFTITAELQHIRLDKFLAAQMPEISRSLLKKLIQNSDVTVNGEKKKAHYPLKKGDILKIIIPPATEPEEPKPQDIPLDIIYEDSYILVLNKQAGLVVHPAAGHPDQTLVNALLHRIGSLEVERDGIVHRLDKDTSGVMVVAKTDKAYNSLVQQFKTHQVKKNYLCITRGIPKNLSGVITFPLGRDSKMRKKITLKKNGREAVTEYEVIEQFCNYAFLLVKPKTGRTHQIRVHLKLLGTPVLCDGTYSRKSVLYNSELSGSKKEQGEKPLIDRQALHAKLLTFIHPESGGHVTFEAPIPADIQNTLESLRSFKQTD